MKKVFFLLLFLAAGINVTFSQTENKPIEIEKSLLKTYLYQDTCRTAVTPKMLCEIVAGVPEAQRDAQIARGFRIARNSCFIASGANLTFCVVSRYLTSRYSSFYLARIRISGIACVGFLATGCIFGAISNSHATKAANIYNAKIGETAHNDVSLDFGLTPNGIGLTLCF